MGVEHRRVIAQELIEGGLEASTAVAVVEQAWTGQQRTIRGKLEDLTKFDVRPPAIIVVGGVASFDLRSLHVVDVALL